MSDQQASVCKRCGGSEPNVSFGLRNINGRQYRRHLCRVCFNQYTQERRVAKGQTYTERHKRYALKRKASRAAGKETDRWILEDSIQSDRKHGRMNDLDRSFICSLIAGGCAYCGETNLRMTLDRIDNTKGHTRDNVVPACIRCNYARKDMPYTAWLTVATGMRAAREAGLFGEWTGRIK